ncbi:hypothetical protein LJC06_00380 [Bacteroidales bacterium OttesenSCG-928-I14]|nr:hypothetical protein [Bacteroidales bacterium OttesenSCG-928-I14]
MIKTNKYKGLLFLKNKGFPVPYFLKVESKSQLNDSFFDSNAIYGWTIRTCKKNGLNEMSLFYKNQISKEELFEILDIRLKNNTDEFYIVYHSWDFWFSFNLIKERYSYIIEGKFGSQKEISLGIEQPFFSLTYNCIAKTFNSHNNYLSENGCIKYILKSINYMERIYSNDSYYTEVAVTRNKELFFYELWTINELI